MIDRSRRNRENQILFMVPELVEGYKVNTSFPPLASLSEAGGGKGWRSLISPSTSSGTRRTFSLCALRQAQGPAGHFRCDPFDKLRDYAEHSRIKTSAAYNIQNRF